MANDYPTMPGDPPAGPPPAAPEIPFSNPRRWARFEDWPNGRFLTTCAFKIEYAGLRGERVVRTTLDKNGRPCKPKYTTYATKYAIVDGDDGRTYLLAYSTQYGASVTVKSADMQHNAPGPLGKSYVPDDDPLFAPLFDLIKSAT